MMRKFLFVVLCGFVQRFECSRVKFEPSFSEFANEPVYKREHFYPRAAIASPEQIHPQQGLIRNDAMCGNEQMMVPQQPILPNLPSDEYLSSDQIIQGEPFIRAEPIMRREAFMRREPIIRRDAFIRAEPLIRAGRVFQNPQFLREGGMFRNEPNAYALMVSTQCPCQEAQNGGPSTGSQDSFFQITQPIQPMQQPPVPTPCMQQSPMPAPCMQQPSIPAPCMQQPIMAQRIIFQKPMLKPPMYQPIIALPRIQRLVRKNFKPLAENVQFSPNVVPNTPVQDFNSLTSEPVSFPGTFQNPESTSESTQNNPVTVRSLPQMANPLALAQMSSIC